MKVQLWHLEHSKNSFHADFIAFSSPSRYTSKNQTAKLNHTWHGRTIPSCFDFHAVQFSLPKNYIPETLIAPGPSLKEQRNWSLKFHFIRLQKSHKYLKGTFSIQWYQYPFNFTFIFFFILFGKILCSKSKLNLLT